MFKQKFAIKTLNTILIEPNQKAPFVSNEEKIVTLMALRDNGYLFKPSNIIRLIEMDISVNTMNQIQTIIKQIRGGNVNHSTLLGSFPIQNPNNLSRSFLAFINHVSSIYNDIPNMLESDKAVYQLNESGNAIYLDITQSIDDDVIQLLTTKIPLSLDHEEFVADLFKSNDPVLDRIDPTKIVLKEILARQIAFELNSGKNTLSARNAIDILRAVALISGEPNAKLDEQFKIKSLTNDMRRKIVETLDAVATIDDLVAKKGLFKRLLKVVHVHEKRFQKFKNIRELATQLQTLNNPKTSRTELHKLVQGIGTEEGFDVVLNNPSLFIRNLDAILRKHSTEAILQLFRISLTKRDVETKLLLQILEHFRNRDQYIEKRFITPKGKSKQVIVDKPLEAMKQSVIDELNNIIKAELKRQYSKRETFMNKVYIDPSLYKINIPKDLSIQDGLKVAARGSRYPVDIEGDTLRLFVHWKDACDIDLSGIVLTEDYNVINSISFSNLSGKYYEHSGDVRSAPSGGTEHIDFYLNQLPKGTRYVGMAINCWSGKDFDDIPELFGGFMIRKDRFGGKKFEPKTVVDKFSISGGVEFKLTVLFDVLTREIVVVNTSMGIGAHVSVGSVSFKNHLKGILDRKTITVGELIELHSSYVLCEDEQKTMSEDELKDVVVFDKDYGFNVIDITSNLL